MNDETERDERRDTDPAPAPEAPQCSPHTQCGDGTQCAADPAEEIEK